MEGEAGGGGVGGGVGELGEDEHAAHGEQAEAGGGQRHDVGGVQPQADAEQQVVRQPRQRQVRALPVPGPAPPQVAPEDPLARRGLLQKLLLVVLLNPRMIQSTSDI